MKRPPNIQPNDKAVILSPAGKIDKEFIFGAADKLKQWGLSVEIAQYALCESGRFAGTVKQRLSDLQKAMDDPDVKLIFCSRGGYGAVQLLDKLDFTEIKKKPKWLIGYSDITALHCAWQANGMMSLHAPMAKHFSEEGMDDAAVNYTKDILLGQSVTYQIPNGKNSYLNRVGCVAGVLFGGNLSVFCGLLGTPYLRIPDDGILFIEDIGESPYKVERMMYQLKYAGVFDKINGLIVGQFTDYEEDASMPCALHKSIYNLVSDYSFPICFDSPVGHAKENLPMIVNASISMIVKEDKSNFGYLDY